MPHASQSGWTARPHGDTVHRQFPVFCDQRWREILNTHARSPGHYDDISVSPKRFENGIAVVTDEAREVDHASIALDERREHWPVGIGNSKTAWAGAGRQEFIACHQKAHNRAADHAHLTVSHGT